MVEEIKILKTSCQMAQIAVFKIILIDLFQTFFAVAHPFLTDLVVHSFFFHTAIPLPFSTHSLTGKDPRISCSSFFTPLCSCFTVRETSP